MFDGIKIFTIRMIAGANVASVILMMAVGYSDHLSPEHFALLSTAGLFLSPFPFRQFLLFVLLADCQGAICSYSVFGLFAVLCVGKEIHALEYL